MRDPPTPSAHNRGHIILCTHGSFLRPGVFFPGRAAGPFFWESRNTRPGKTRPGIFGAHPLFSGDLRSFRKLSGGNGSFRGISGENEGKGSRRTGPSVNPGYTGTLGAAERTRTCSMIIKTLWGDLRACLFSHISQIGIFSPCSCDIVIVFPLPQALSTCTRSKTVSDPQKGPTPGAAALIRHVAPEHTQDGERKGTVTYQNGELSRSYRTGRTRNRITATNTQATPPPKTFNLF